MSTIDAIKERHSVRNYKETRIEADKVEAINALIEKANEEGNLHLQFLEDAGKTFGRLLNKAMGLSSAPSVIACVGPDEEGVEERVGYYGERIVIALQEMGLNTCWAGTYSPSNVKAEIKDGEKLVIVIAVGYGQTPGKVRRSKTEAAVTSGKEDKPEWFDFGVEMALLAPTAINQQKFEIRLEDDDTVTFIDKGGVHSKTDLGIVKYHFEAGADYIKNQDK